MTTQCRDSPVGDFLSTRIGYIVFSSTERQYTKYQGCSRHLVCFELKCMDSLSVYQVIGTLVNIKMAFYVVYTKMAVVYYDIIALCSYY